MRSAIYFDLGAIFQPQAFAVIPALQVIKWKFIFTNVILITESVNKKIYLVLCCIRMLTPPVHFFTEHIINTIIEFLDLRMA